ncbi:hypothetical protein [Pararhodobacter zhoushanensis]|uniref:DUF1127 domain-containing protein n=1 Tax=Pararhodobacter zhoushanensis TaxID=2479545 RepID=A0ABT3GZW3_9RHOB|nr:hypothetical protein [Pararhodobacter zhoushanensis]MCW1933015.1 hypothetical protein [Pararhodobacter zhoushanensis]
MAFISATDFTPRIRAQIDAFFATLGQGFNAYLEARSRRDEIERLQMMTDAQLAELGTSRDRIVHHVFRDRIGF